MASSRIDSFKLTRERDRRTKTTEEDVAEMRRLYDKGVTQKAIAEMFHMSQSAVCYIVSPKAHENLRKYRLKNPPKRRTKEESTSYMRDLREYKTKIKKELG